MNKQVIKRLLGFLKPYGGYLIAALVSAVLNVTLTLLAPVLIGDGVDRIIGKGQVDFKGLAPILLWLGFAILFAALFQWIMTLCTNIVTHRTVRDLRIAVFHKLNRVPLKTIDSNSHGDLISRVVNDIDQVSDGLLQGFSQLFTGVITIVGTLVFMLSINWVIALVVVLVTPLSLFVASFIAKRSYNMFREQSAVRGELGGYVEEMVGNQKIVKTFRYEERAQQHFEQVNARLYDCGVKAQFYSSLTNPCTRFVNGVVYAAVGIIGAVSAISGRLTVGQLSCFLSYANQYTKPFNEISGVVTELQSAFASAKRVFDVLDEEDEPAEEPNAVQVRDCQGFVQLSDVAFSYRKGVPLIQGLNLTAKPGQKIAIVGPTGCGKTTIINLLMRFYDIQQGRIEVDGTDIRQMTRQSLRSAVRHGAAGHLAVLRNRAGQHRLRKAGRHRRRGRGSRQSRPRPQLYQAPGKGVRHPGCGGRWQPVPGAEAAFVHRPGDAHRPAHADFGRGHQQHRHPHGDPHPEGV